MQESGKKKKPGGKGSGQLKDQQLGDSRSRDHPNNSSRGSWEGRGEDGWDMGEVGVVVAAVTGGLGGCEE